MSKLIASVIAKIVVKLAQYAIIKVVEYFDRKKLKKRKKQRNELSEKIKNAKNDEERKKYLEALNRL